MLFAYILDYFLNKSKRKLKKLKKIEKKYSDAEFSEDRLNRYSATRIWKMNGKYLLVIGSYPSYGDETNNDKTLNKLIEIISKDPKYGGFVIVNLLDNKNNPSVKNIEYIKKHLDDPEIEKVVLAWGNIKNSCEKWTKYINKDIFQLIENNTKEKLCIGKNKNGTPTNPGRLKFLKKKFKGLQKWYK